MPELPEVETVRLGLVRDVVGASVADVIVSHPRAVRRQEGGVTQFTTDLQGQTISAVHRRGKYLWFDLGTDDSKVFVTHLGMSGQFRVMSAAVHDPHARVDLRLSDGRVLRFRDQRTFGWVLIDEIVEVNGARLPKVAAHIAPDPFSAHFRDQDVLAKIAKSRAGIKRILLDQRVVSGIGNIYADEALWTAQIHYETPGCALPKTKSARLLGDARDVMSRSLAAGGTSFDALYVDIGGEQGWFATALNAYGREDEACPRCGTPIRREKFTNRSSYFCPSCQPFGSVLV